MNVDTSLRTNATVIDSQPHYDNERQPYNRNSSNNNELDIYEAAAQELPFHISDSERKYVRIGDRLIIDFEKMICLPCDTSGLHPDVRYQIPDEIREVMTTAEWCKLMTELDEIQINMAPSLFGVFSTFFLPLGFPQWLFCAMFCPISGDHKLKCLPCCTGDWHAALRDWQKNINCKLNPYDMHAKLLTYKPFFQTPPKSKLYDQRTTPQKDANYEMSFLAIALTREESCKLKTEYWNHGFNHGCKDNCTSGIGRYV